jgi:hypothetical protein
MQPFKINATEPFSKNEWLEIPGSGHEAVETWISHAGLRGEE